MENEAFECLTVDRNMFSRMVGRGGAGGGSRVGQGKVGEYRVGKREVGGVGWASSRGGGVWVGQGFGGE